MGLNNKKLNIIIGIDTVNANVKIMRIFGKDTGSAKVEYIPAPVDALNRGEWDKVIEETLSEYMEQQHISQSFAVWLVLPDRTIGTDIITMPTIKHSKMNVALETQMQELYRFYKNVKFNKFILSANKTNTTFEIVMVNKELLNTVYKALSKCKLYVKNATYASSASLNSVFALRPKTRRANFIFVDIKPDCAMYSVSMSGKTVGYTFLPFGYNILRSDKILNESSLFNNDLAQIAVLNATEKARRKKMTTLEEEEETNVIEESAIYFNEISSAPESEMTEESESQVMAASENADISVSESPTVKSKTYIRKTKRLPAFMQRPVPETLEGIAAENFRYFVKQALLIRQHNMQTAYLAEPEFILFNMPEEYGYIVDYLNKEDESGIVLRYFSPGKENNVYLTDNLDLYGALYMNHFNRMNNF